MPILETQSLTRRFGELTAVDRLTFSIQAGEVFGLLGPNGARKTTTIKMLITLLPPTSGDVDMRRVIGYVPQLLSADGTLTGYENLLIFAKLYDIPRAERKERVRAALAFMGLTDSADKLVREYSGGMIRRLEIAQSMRHRPRRPPHGVGPHPAVAPRLRHHHPVDHPHDGGSRGAMHAGGHHASGPFGRHRHARRAEGSHWRQWRQPGRLHSLYGQRNRFGRQLP
jgi:ABC-type histidine transport system ATPase subunit